jgi:hypothetical protein
MGAKTRPNTRDVSLHTPTDLSAEATRDISGALNVLLADLFALYLKTKNFHWHLSGPHFRDYHLLFDEQADLDGRLDTEHKWTTTQGNAGKRVMRRCDRPSRGGTPSISATGSPPVVEPTASHYMNRW